MALSRKEVLEEYDVDRHGLIRDHGKFEREPLWVPALWDAALEGGSDEDFEDEVGQPVSAFFLDERDYKEFPELKDEGIKVVVLWEQDNGFVRQNTFKTKAAYEKARQEMEESRDDGSGPDDEEIEEEGPVEGDLTTGDYKTFWEHGMSRRRPAVEVDIDASTEEMWAALDAWMEKQQFYPNVWFISDHGNVSLMTRKRR